MLAPREHLHAERPPDRRHLPSDVPQPYDAQRPAAQPEPDRPLPAALPDPAVLLRHAPDQRQDQRPGQLGRGPPVPRVPHTVTPAAAVAARSIEAFRIPVVTSS